MSSVYTHEFRTSVYNGDVSVHTTHFINGQFVEPSTNEVIDVINPANEKHMTTVAAGSLKDVDDAVHAAKAAYKSAWGLKVPGSERGRLLYKLADLFEAHLDELAALEALNADKNNGQIIETNELKFTYTRHEPIGVCAMILPWNFPLMLAAHKLFPALATGNTVVLKPSELTPLSTLKLAELIRETGFPPGVVNIVNGYGPVVGQALAEHPLVNKISFTGSTLVGRKIMEASGKSNLKRVTLELGGKSPTIIFDDANLDQAVKVTASAIFFHSGQICVAGSRIFVQEGIYDRFVQAFTAVARSYKQGDGFDPSNTQGPLVSESQLKRIMGYIESGKAEGATLVTGGQRVDKAGYFVEPTIFTDVRPDMKMIREEIFGPVCAIIKFKEEEEVIDMANDTVYGLSAVVFTENISRAIRVVHALDSGQAFVNMGLVAAAQVPFGGFKQSGFGKELGQYALEAYTNVKAVHVNLSH